MLGDAVDGAEATDEGGTVDPHNLPVGKKWAQEVESGLIGRGVEDRHEDGRVGDVEVGVAGLCKKAGWLGLAICGLVWVVCLSN